MQPDDALSSNAPLEHASSSHVDVQYVVDKQAIRAPANHALFLLTNRHGDYCSFGDPNSTNYNGLFMKLDEQYYKILYDITPIASAVPIVSTASIPASVSSATSNGRDPRVLTLRLDGVGALRCYTQDNNPFPACSQELFLLEQGLLAVVHGHHRITFDCKRLYDESDRGRMYAVTTEMSGDVRIVTISYTKYSDESLQHEEYSLYTTIVTTLGVDILNTWREVSYLYDKRRGTKSTPWVFDACSVRGEGVLACVTGMNKDRVRHDAIDLFSSRERRLQEHRLSFNAGMPTLRSHEHLAWRALDALCTRTGIMAGLPWFFQEWSRDELISLGGVLAAKRYTQAISCIETWCSVVRPDGTLPAMYPNKGLASADASGWLGKRMRDVLLQLSDENAIHQLHDATLARWRDVTGKIIDSCLIRKRDGLIWNEYNTTWMDTSKDDDGRAGARIEIQALFLALFDAHAHLCTMTRTRVEPSRASAVKEVLESVHTKLYVDGVLYDGLHMDGTLDTVIRPNVFVAWYVAPKLFSQEQWKRIFDTVLPELWLPWGGLSSIAKSSPLFKGRYTGEDVASYHRGDSWYFINNMAALAMHDVDPLAYDENIRAIARASTYDLLSIGCLGHASELSSADVQELAGCFAQAWSASTLLELLVRLRSTR